MALREDCGVDAFIDYLNELLKIDSDMVNDLFGCYSLCNETLANHQTVQCFSAEHANKYLHAELLPGQFCVRFLGIINGFFGTYSNGAGPICADIDKETGKIKEFRRTVEPHIPADAAVIGEIPADKLVGLPTRFFDADKAK